MRRIFAALLAATALVCGASEAVCQTGTVFSFRTVAPASTPSGSGDTVLTITGPQTNSNRYNFCFYNNVTNATLVPSSFSYSAASGTASYTVTVPGTSFQTAGAAASPKIYVVAGGASVANGCTGTSPGLSNTFAYSITAVNYRISSASPSSINTGSGSTSITFSGSLPTFTSTGLGLCFYASTNNAPLLPASQSGSSSASFLVPSADFDNASTAKVYAATATSTCTGTNPGYSSTFSFPVKQVQNYTITAASPSPLPAGSGDVSITLQGTANGTDRLNDGVCFYTGSSSSTITPDDFSDTSATFTAPASSFNIPASKFSSGIYNATVYLNPFGQTCTGTNPGISNTFTIPIQFPVLDSVGLAALAQPNTAAGVLPYPRTIQLYGSNFLPGPNTQPTFTPQGGSSIGQAEIFLDDSDIQSVIPYAQIGASSSVAITACSDPTTNGGPYCSAAQTIPTYQLAASTTQLTSTPAAPAPGSSAKLTAIITPGAGSSTPGGTYVPGPPTGTVTFKDGQTTLGSAPLTAGSLSLANASSQVINVLAGSDGLPGTSASGRPRPAGRIQSPYETPAPDTNTQFTSLTADFNQDGIPDILLIQTTSNVMHLFLSGSPAGTLQGETTILAGLYCTSLSGVTVADLNKDGYPDIAYLCGDSGGESSIQTLLNQGDGTFPDYGNYVTGGVFGNQLAAADVNKDGNVDLVMTGQTSPSCCETVTYGMRTYFGDGTGNFTQGPASATTDVPGTQVILKDLNNDGIPDLVFLHVNSTTSATEVSVFQGTGSGTFTSVANIPVCNCTTSTAKLFALPLTTSTAFSDIIVAFPDSNSVITALNKRTAALAFAAPTSQTFTTLKDAVLGDFTGDGLTDLAFYDGSSTSIASGNGSGSFTLNPNFQAIATGQSAIALAAAPDLNLDGYADLLAVRPLIRPYTTTVESYVTTGTASATLSTSQFTTGGSHAINTAYNGNLDLLGSNGTTTVNVPAPVAPTLLAFAPPNPNASTSASRAYQPGGTFALNFLVSQSTSDTRSALAPTGLVSIVENGTQLASQLLTKASATSASASFPSFGNATVGSHTLTITYGGDPNFNSVSQVFTYTITKATPVITWAPPASTNTTTPVGSTILNATSSVPGTFVYTPAAGSYLPFGTSTLSAAFTPTDATNYSTVSTTRTINVAKTDPVITTSINPADHTYTPNLPTYYTINIAGTNIRPTGTVQFFTNGTTDGPAAGTGASGPTSINSTITYASLPANTFHLSAQYLGDSVYNSATSAVTTYTVSQATPTLTFNPNPATIPAGTPLSSSQLDATSDVPGSFSYTPSLGTVLSSGDNTITAVFTPSDTQDYKSLSTTAVVHVLAAAVPVLLTYNPTPNTVPYGTPVSASQLNAVATDKQTGASVPGTFFYSVDPGTILPVGQNTIDVTFDPDDTTKYTATYSSAIINVLAGTTATTLQVTANGAPVTSVPAGTVVTLTATVTGTASPLLGQVNFCDTSVPVCTGTGLVGSAQLTASGTATIRFVPSIGNHSYQANFAGTTQNLATSSVSSVLAVTGTFPTATTLQSTSSVGNYTLTATVTGIGSQNASPSGSVSFLDTSNGNAPLGAVFVGEGVVRNQTFAAGTPVPVGTRPAALLTGDFNGDGIADILTVNSDSPDASEPNGSISVLLGVGDGTFKAASTLNLGGRPGAAVAGDFDHDGILDLAVADSSSGIVHVLHGSGDGTFQPVNRLGLEASPNSLAIGDFDRDGLLDLAVTVEEGQVYTYKGVGDGSFSYFGAYEAESTPDSIATGDFNGDGILDLAVANRDDSDVSIFLGQPDGSFSYGSDPSAGNAPAAIVVADFNKDGIPDLAVDNGTGNISILLGNGDGSFTTGASVPFTGTSHSIAVADLNGDTIPDLVIDNGSASTFFGNGDGTFTAGPASPASTPATGAALADLNGDGLVDIAAVDVASNSAFSALNNVTVSSVASTANVSPSGSGNHQVIARYPGNAVFGASDSSPVTLQGQILTTTLSWTPAPLSFGTPLGAAQLNAVASDASGLPIPGTFVYNPAAGTILQAGLQTLSVSFTPTDLAHYSNAALTTTVQVSGAATSTLISSNANPAPYGSPVTITATITSAVGSATTPITGTLRLYDGESQIGNLPVVNGLASLVVSNFATGPHYLSALYTGDTVGDYLSSSASGLTQIVNKAQPVLTFAPNPATIPYGTPLSAAQLDAVQTVTSIAGLISYSSPFGTVLPVGPNTITATFTPTDTANYTSITKTAIVTVTPFNPTITWPAPSPIAFGTALSSTQLNAVANDINGTAIPGTYSYSPAAGTILPVGPTLDTLTFTPTNTTNFKTASASRTITVNQGATTTAITALPASIAVGQSTTLTISVTPVNGTGLVSGQVALADDHGTITPATVTLLYGVASVTYTPTAAGTHVLTATFAGNTSYTASSASTTLSVGQGQPVLTFAPNPASIPYGTPLTAAQLDAVQTVTSIAGLISYSSPLGTVLPVGPNTITATFTPTDTANFATITKAAVVTVTPFKPTITWPAPSPIAFGAALSSTQLNAVANDINGTAIPGTYSYSPAAGTVLPVGATVDTVTFAPTNTTNFTTATATRTITVNGLSTTTALTSTPNPAAFGTPVTLTATIAPVAGSATVPITGAVSFVEGQSVLGTANAVNGVASLPISTLTVRTHTIFARFAGDTAGDYLASTSATLSQVIDTVTPTISWTPNPATIVYGTRLTTAQLNAVARTATGTTIPGTFVYTPAAGAIVAAPGTTLSTVFTPTDSVHYATATATAPLTVTPATPTITWSTPAPVNQGTPLSSTQLNATATGIDGLALPGTFTYTPAAGTILTAGPHTLSVTFVPADAINYITTTANVSINILNPLTSAVLISSVNPSQFGQPIVLTATIAIPTRGTNPPSGNVTFFDGTTQLGKPVTVTPTSAGAEATLTLATLATGVHQLTAVFDNDPNYVTSTSLPLAQTVNIAPVTLSWIPTVASIPYGTPLSAAQLNAVPVSPFASIVTGLLTYAPAAGTVLNAGAQTLTATFTPSDTLDFLPAAGSTVINVTRVTPALGWTAPASITQGTPLSATQLNATATGINQLPLAGTFTYTPAAGTILPSGPATLTVVFTPTDAVNYTTATATVPITVDIPTASITLASTANPSQYGQPITFTATVTPGGTQTAVPTGLVRFFDGTQLLPTATLDGTGRAMLPLSSLTAGTHSITAVYAGDTANSGVTSAALGQVVNKAPAVITFAPNPASIVYGTALSPSQLDATAASQYIANVPGTFVYNPALGTLLNAGTQTLTVSFTPADAANFSSATQTATLAVTRATPVVTFPTPAAVPVGTTLSATQLNATAVGVTGAALPGTFTYTPAAGTRVTAGPQTLSVTFTPTDTVNYTTATATTTLNGTAVTLTSLSSNSASLGDPAKTITLTGTGFVSDSVARSNGVALATTYVNPTTLSAVIPASNFQMVETLQITVNNPTQVQTTSALPFTVSAPPVAVTVNGPTTANPGDQPTIKTVLATAYPVDVTGTFSLSFTPISGGVVDPAIQFSNGGTRQSFTIPAGQVTNPTVQIQTGTVAGTVTIRLALMAGGVDVTPTNLAPLVINIPTVAPGVTSVTLVRSGKQITVRTLGFSNTREVTQARFHFTSATGQPIQTPDVVVDVTSLFAGWYAQTASAAYGSTFLYTQTFTLDDDASVVGQVSVSLTNSAGASASGSSQ